MRISFLLLLLLSQKIIWAQIDVVELQQKYPFLILEENEIEFPGGEEPFYHFYKKLDTLIFDGKGQVNVLHIGGSHVQAGTLSNRMRMNMLSMSPDLKNERGFFFPYTLAHTNNPRNYKISSNGEWEGCRCAVSYHDCNWGLSGVNATTKDSNTFVKIYAFDDTSVYSFSRVRIYYEQGETSYEIKIDKSLPIKSMRVDSISSYTEFNFENSYDTLMFELVKTDSIQDHFTIQGIEYITDQPSLIYHSIGVNGASTKSYLRCENFSDQLLAVAPDLVIFGIGINDAHKPENQFDPAAFESQYLQLMDMFKKANKNCAFLFLTNNDSYYKRRYPNPNIYKVITTMKKICREHDAAFWDLFKIMGGYNSIKSWQNYDLAKKDKIHFTNAGYELQADLMFDALMRSYGDYLKANY